MDAYELDADLLFEHFRNRVIHHGARSGQLLKYSPEVIELLYPAAQYGDSRVAEQKRARNTARLIRRAIDLLGGDTADAILEILALSSGTLSTTLEARRRMAAKSLGITADSFRRERWERDFLFNLAVEVCGLREEEDPYL